MFKDISKKEETVLKKAFNNWGIFDLYEKLNIIIKPLEKEHLAKFEGKFRAGFLKKVNLAQIEKKTPQKNTSKKNAPMASRLSIMPSKESIVPISMEQD